MTETDALTAALVIEHQAVYAYGVLGARLDDVSRAAALTAFDEHRSRRNWLTALLLARQAPAPGPAAAYDVLVPGRLQALQLAVRVEETVATRWRDLVAATDAPELRRLAVAALQDCAVRAAGWRRLAGILSLTVPLPGTA